MRRSYESTTKQDACSGWSGAGFEEKPVHSPSFVNFSYAIYLRLTCFSIFVIYNPFHPILFFSLCDTSNFLPSQLLLHFRFASIQLWSIDLVSFPVFVLPRPLCFQVELDFQNYLFRGMFLLCICFCLLFSARFAIFSFFIVHISFSSPILLLYFFNGAPSRFHLFDFVHPFLFLLQFLLFVSLR